NDPIFTRGGTSSPTNTPAPTVAPTTKPTTVPTITQQPTATPVPGSTILNLTVSLQGIGSGGDSANPHSQGNTNQHRITRTVTLEIYNSQNQLVVTQQG